MIGDVKFHIPIPAWGFILKCRGAMPPPGDTRLHTTAFYRTPFRLTVLVLSGITLIATISGCQRSPSPDVMATVNGKDILRSEVEKYYTANLGDNTQKPSPSRLTLSASISCGG